MEENQILSKVTDAFLEKDILSFTVEYNKRLDRSLLDRLFFRKPKFTKAQKEFIIKPIKVANWTRVAGAAVLLPSEIIDGSYATAVLPMMADRDIRDKLIYIAASAIQNNLEEPKKELIGFIEEHFDAITLQEAVIAALDALNMPSFLNTITLAKGSVNFLKPEESPMDGRE